MNVLPFPRPGGIQPEATGRRKGCAKAEAMWLGKTNRLRNAWKRPHNNGWTGKIRRRGSRVLMSAPNGPLPGHELALLVKIIAHVVEFLDYGFDPLSEFRAGQTLTRNAGGKFEISARCSISKMLR
jgi:hypothetical protein